MWDIEQIIRNNNNAALDWFMRGKRVNEASDPVLEDWPLSKLASKMVSGPISLKALNRLFYDNKSTTAMANLTERFLPEFRAEIMSGKRGQQVRLFCKRFSDKYFPLGSYVYNNSIHDLLTSLPVELSGLSMSAYHDFDFRQGYLLLMSLVVYPFEFEASQYAEFNDDDGDDDSENDNGGRIPLLDIAQNNVGPEVISKILEDGWLPSELHDMTDGTKYDGLGSFADWACGCTNCVVLDYSYSECEYAEGESQPLFRWSKYNVEILSGQSKKVAETRSRIDRIVQWVEANPDENFTELVNFMVKKYEKPKRRNFSDFHNGTIELETITSQEEYDDMKREFYGEEKEVDGSINDGHPEEAD